MALYAIGDLHLSFGSNKPMDVFGGRWENYTEKILEGFSSLDQDDVCVLCGDVSWGMSLEEAKEDFLFIDRLPGRKIILKGNHDYWWSTASKAYKFFEECGVTTISFLNNNCHFYEDYALCGTRGWFYEEEKDGAHDKKVMLREIMRLETSLKCAGDRKKLVFLHYPPKYQAYSCPEILQLLRDYDVPLCCYGHLHGKSCAGAFGGRYEKTDYLMVSADHVQFRPVKILE